MKYRSNPLIAALVGTGAVLAAATWTVASQEKPAEPIPALIGGQGSVIATNGDAFSLPARNSSPKHRRSFVVGNSLFKENWVASPASVKSRQGLGPFLNAHSCSSCHFKDGRGAPPGGPTEAFSSMLVRLSIPGKGAHGEPMPVPNYGDQLRHRAIVGVKPAGDVRVSYDELQGTYPDGTKYSLLKPAYAFQGLRFGPMPDSVQLSARVAPAVIGLGLLEAISEKDILALADPGDRDGDGVSGRANQVWDFERKKKRLGRFGWKANQPTVHQQNAGAFFGDMGITSGLFPKSDCPPAAEDCAKAYTVRGTEIDDRDMEHMNAYVKLLAVPARRNVNDPIVQAGEKRFLEARCQTCHTVRFTTGVDRHFPENSKQVIFPFTDLLLHDMGEGLADNRPDFEASGSEWRTPPLWGIGLVKEVNGHTRFLHDGRARNLEEAILWHGGEAAASRDKFRNLSLADRQALIQFLESL